MNNLNNYNKKLVDHLNIDFIRKEEAIQLIIDEISSTVGNLNNLNTTTKDNLVSAINEIVAKINVLETDIESAFQLGNNVKRKLVAALIAKGIRKEEIATSDLMNDIFNHINWLGDYKAYYDYEFTITTANYTITLFDDPRGDNTPGTKYTDWGDGTIDTELTHKYTKTGVFRVKTKYVIYRTNGFGNSNTAETLTNIFNVNNKATDWSYLFRDCKKLINVDANNWDASHTINFFNMFKNCINLQTFDNENWQIKTDASMSYMFDGCYKLQ